MLNRVILIGRLTRDPELRYTPAGVAVTTFTLAIDRPYMNQQREREADFIPIVTWRQLAETCANYLTKGRLAAVEGRLQVRTYDNNEGKKVYVTEVVADNVRFLESANSAKAGGGAPRDDFAGGGYTQPGPGASSMGMGGGGYASGGGQPQRGSASRGMDPFQDDGRPIDISDDDLPF